MCQNSASVTWPFTSLALFHAVHSLPFLNVVLKRRKVLLRGKKEKVSFLNALKPCCGRYRVEAGHQGQAQEEAQGTANLAKKGKNFLARIEKIRSFHNFFSIDSMRPYTTIDRFSSKKSYFFKKNPYVYTLIGWKLLCVYLPDEVVDVIDVCLFEDLLVCRSEVEGQVGVVRGEEHVLEALLDGLDCKRKYKDSL